MSIFRKPRTILIKAGLLLTLGAPPAQAAKEIHWYLADVPAVHVANGERKNQGFVDQMLTEQLIPKLSKYEHKIQIVPAARREGMLKSDTKSCAPGLFKNGDRGSIVFSSPYLAALSPGIFGLKDSEATTKRFESKLGQLNLQQILKDGKLTVGVVAGRSYGADMDKILASYAGKPNIYQINSRDAVDSLKKMLLKKRIDLVLANPYEPGFLEFTFWPLADQPDYMLVYAACARSDEGKEIIADINKILRQPSVREAARKYFESWLKKEHVVLAKNVQEKAKREFKD